MQTEVGGLSSLPLQQSCVQTFYLQVPLPAECECSLTSKDILSCTWWAGFNGVWELFNGFQEGFSITSFFYLGESPFIESNVLVCFQLFRNSQALQVFFLFFGVGGFVQSLWIMFPTVPHTYFCWIIAFIFMWLSSFEMLRWRGNI